MRKMKNSGYQWMGEIPTEWGVSKVGNFFYFSSGDTLTSESILNEGKYLVYGANGVRGYYNTSNLSGKHILLGRVGALCGNVHIVEGDIWVTEHALVAHTKSKVCEEYYGYIFEAMNLLQYSKASAQPVISSDTISNLRFPVPTLAEQKKIADFLDRTCSEIDAVIAKTKATIEEYKALKQSIITETVTKGIRGDRAMKDSGVEWIGDIPAEWNVRKLKTFASMISKGATPKDMSNEKNEIYSIRFLKSENIVSNQLVEEPIFYIEEQIHTGELKRSALSADDILFVIAGASIGKVAIMNADLLPSNTNQAVSFIRIMPKYSDIQKYIWYVLQSDMIKTYISLFSVQSAQPNISMENLGNFRLPYIDDNEEIAEIVEYLDMKCAEIDTLIAKKTALLEEMENYKKSVIYEYVTGKKEVK